MFTAMGEVIRRVGSGKSRGQTIVMFAIGLVMLIGMVGLAIDGGRAYVVSAQLSKAVDAAVLAGAKASGTPTEIEGVVERVRRVNFPANYLGTSGVRTVRLVVNPNDREPGTGYAARSIAYTAEASLPVTFMRVLGFTDMPITKSATSLRRVMDIILVVDRSASIGLDPMNRYLKPAIRGFLNLFDTNVDRVGILTYAGNLTWLEPRMTGAPGFDLYGLQDQVDRIQMAGWTASGPAMAEAREEMYKLQQLTGQEARWRVILFFTDGCPNTIYFKLQDDTNPLRLAPCNSPGRSQPYCGSDRDCPGETDIREGVHLSAGEADNPVRGGQQFIFGLYRHISRPGSRSQQYDVFDKHGFKAEAQPCDPDDPDCVSSGDDSGSLVYAPGVSGRGGPFEGCYDPRQLIELSNYPSDINIGRRLEIPPPGSGRELPLKDASRDPISFEPKPGVSIRNVTFRLTDAGPPRYMDLRKKINGMARNYLENAADRIRQDGITIYSIGLNGIAGQLLRQNREWNEYGYDICMRVANVPEARGGYFNPSQPQGLFVLAANPSDLSEAFTKVANSILRLSH